MEVSVIMNHVSQCEEIQISSTANETYFWRSDVENNNWINFFSMDELIHFLKMPTDFEIEKLAQLIRCEIGFAIRYSKCQIVNRFDIRSFFDRKSIIRHDSNQFFLFGTCETSRRCAIQNVCSIFFLKKIIST